MIIREFIGTIRSAIKEDSTDSVLTNREIWSLAWSAVLLLIQRETDQKKSIFRSNIFKSLVIQMKEVPIADLDIPIDCTVYRSIDKLPAIVQSKFGFIYNDISTLDRSVQFDIVTPQLFRIKTKITKGKGKFVYFDNGYLFSNYKYPLRLTVLLQDVKDMLKIEGGCKILDLPIPFPAFLVAPAIQSVIQELSEFKRVPQDTTENNNPNS